MTHTFADVAVCALMSACQLGLGFTDELFKKVDRAAYHGLRKSFVGGLIHRVEYMF